MSGPYKYQTGILFTLSDAVGAAEHDVRLTLKYTVYPGCAPTLEQPGEGPSVSIQSATVYSHIATFRREYDAPEWLWPYLESDEALVAELLAHAANADEYARDQAADARREERTLERGR